MEGEDDVVCDGLTVLDEAIVGIDEEANEGPAEGTTEGDWLFAGLDHRTVVRTNKRHAIRLLPFCCEMKTETF